VTEPDVVELRSRLVRYPADRYPAQHATAAFHLGSLHLRRDRVAEALEALQQAREVFDRAGMRLERAKSELMLGVALREAREPVEAAAALTVALSTFAELGEVDEEAAACYNLGLVLGERGDGDAARTALTRARDLFRDHGHPLQAASAARELGGSFVTAGMPGQAQPLLEEAVEAAVRGGDDAGAGGAANLLGLSHLARGDDGAAVEAFRDAVGRHPRSVRPAEHAMAKANLAVALARAGDDERALLAAAQARATPGAAGPVIEQCDGLLAELPDVGDALFVVLDAEPEDRWQRVVRDEVLRWLDSPESVQQAEASGWVRGVLARDAAGPVLVEALLGVLLELPPSQYAHVVGLLVTATGRCAAQEAERFRALARSSMARFPLPQFQRLSATFDRVAADACEPVRWG
jgi:tetratricopeptide (TPR) repeat protein